MTDDRGSHLARCGRLTRAAAALSARARHEAALEALAEAGAVRRANGRLADIGAASGDIRAAAAGWGLEVLSFAESEPAGLMLEPAGFDIVHCSWALHRLAKPSAELREMARATRPGGQVVLQWSLTPREGHAHAIEDVCMALREHGLEIAIAEEDVELAGVNGYAGRVVAHRPAPVATDDDAVRPPRARAFPLAVGILEVIDAVQLSPNMRRLILTGQELAELPAQEPGEILTLIWPAPGSVEIVLPPRRSWRFPEGARQQPARNLTIRALDRARGQITIDFFMHDEDGPASGWARCAAPGDTVGFGGPRAHWVTDPAADWTLLIGDETALPAIGAIIEQRPAGHRTIAVVEVEGTAEEQAIISPCDLEIHWLHRGERAPSRGSELVGAVSALELPRGGRAQVWAAGESLLMRRLREHLRDDRGLPRECLSVLGYLEVRGLTYVMQLGLASRT